MHQRCVVILRAGPQTIAWIKPDCSSGVAIPKLGGRGKKFGVAKFFILD